jgi:Flp pilus assembly protein TadG
MNRKGQAVVELALVIPILLLVLLGIMEFAIIFSNQLIIENASRDSARYAVLGASDNEIQTYAAQLTKMVRGTAPLVTITPSVGSRTKGVAVTVSISYNHILMTPIISNILGSGIQLSASTTMRME